MEEKKKPGRPKKVREEKGPDKIDAFNLFARKPGRSVVMTQEASMAADETVKKTKPAASGRHKNAICEIRRKKD